MQGRCEGRARHVLQRPSCHDDPNVGVPAARALDAGAAHSDMIDAPGPKGPSDARNTQAAIDVLRKKIDRLEDKLDLASVRCTIRRRRSRATGPVVGHAAPAASRAQRMAGRLSTERIVIGL